MARILVIEDVPAAHQLMADLAAAGIDFADVTYTIEREGVASFAKSYTDLLETLDKHAAEL